MTDKLPPMSAEVAMALSHLHYRARLKVLIPDIGDPPNKSTVAAVLFKAVGLPPSEFRQMNEAQLLPFVEQAIAAMKSAEPQKPHSKPVGRPPKDIPRATVNSRMLDELGRAPEKVAWTSRQWAKQLKCAKSTVEGDESQARAADFDDCGNALAAG